VTPPVLKILKAGRCEGVKCAAHGVHKSVEWAAPLLIVFNSLACVSFVSVCRVAAADFGPEMRMKGEMLRADFAGAAHRDICSVARFLFFIFSYLRHRSAESDGFQAVVRVDGSLEVALEWRLAG
jgi:hypothetical protein